MEACNELDLGDVEIVRMTTASELSKTTPKEIKEKINAEERSHNGNDHDQDDGLL